MKYVIIFLFGAFVGYLLPTVDYFLATSPKQVTELKITPKQSVQSLNGTRKLSEISNLDIQLDNHKIINEKVSDTPSYAKNNETFISQIQSLKIENKTLNQQYTHKD